MALMLTTLSLFDKNTIVFYCLESFWLTVPKAQTETSMKSLKRRLTPLQQKPSRQIYNSLNVNTEFEAFVYTMENTFGRNCQHFH